MKNLSLILNIVLLVAVGVLYVLYFADKSGKSKENNTVLESNMDFANMGIAYVNSDSLLNQYDLFNSMKTELEAKRTKLENELGARANTLQNEINAFQKSANNMTVNEIKLTEEKLMMKQQQLMQYKEQLTQNFMQDEAKLNDKLYGKISEYMAQFGKDNNYKIVFGYTKGGGILFANDSLEVTDKVIQGLNALHQQQVENK